MYDVGIIQLANALRVLASVELADEVLAAGYAMDKLVFYDAEGHLLYEVPQPRLAGPDYPSSNALARPQLHKLLQDAVHKASVNVRVGVTVAELEQRNDEVEVTFTDWTNEHYDLVIGTDGLRSLVRGLVFEAEHQPAYAGQMCWRYNVPRPADIDHFQMYLGRSGNKAGFVPRLCRLPRGTVRMIR